MTDKAKIKTIAKYHEIRMQDGRFWRFEYLPDLLKFAKENDIDVKVPPRKIEED